MATRNRVQRGEEGGKAAGIFEGRVRKWRKEWVPMQGAQKLFFYPWRPTEERGAPHIPRANMVAVENPNVKPPLPRIPAPGASDGKHAAKRGRVSLSGLGGEATPAASEGISLGVTQRTEGTAAPKIIRFKLKSSAALATAGAGGALAGAAGAPGAAGAAAAAPAVATPQGGSAAAPGGSPPQVQGTGPSLATQLKSIRLKLPDPQQAQQVQGPSAAGSAAPGLGQGSLQAHAAEVGAGCAPPQPAAALTGAVAPAAVPGGDASQGSREESDDMAVDLSRLEPQEPTSPRNLDALIPDAAAAARHDATAILLQQQQQQHSPATGDGQPM